MNYRRLILCASRAIASAERVSYLHSRRPILRLFDQRCEASARSISVVASRPSAADRFIPNGVEDHDPKIPAITNARRDESGNEMFIYMTPRAAAKLNAIRQADNNPNVFLRVTVESGGCHGFQYLMSLKDTYDPKEDIIFDLDGAKVVMDETSLSILKDSTVDYTTELIGSQFKIVNNPRASSSCGCGSSFDIDLDK